MISSFAPPFAGLLGLGGPEIFLVFIVVLLLFGGAKLPSLAKGLGQSIREFKKASSDPVQPAGRTAQADDPQ